MTKEESRSRLNLILNEGENPYLLIDKIFDDFEKEKQELINKYADLADKYTDLKLKGKERRLIIDEIKTEIEVIDNDTFLWVDFLKWAENE